MWCILEGPDCAGKTTLAGEIAATLGRPVVTLSHGPPRTHPLNEYELPYGDYRPDGEINVISDRLHWGERVYGPLLRGEDRLGDAGFTHVELFVMSRGGFIEYLNPGVTELVRRYRRRGDALVAETQLIAIADAYDSIYRRSSVLKGCNRGAEEIVQSARFAAVVAAPLARFPTYVGSRWPRALLLGETRGNQAPQATGCHPGAFTPFPATSGRYLLDALGPLALDLGFANALEEDVGALVNTLGNLPVVALGQVAREVCKTAGVAAKTVPHPQWVRRFKHAQSAAYQELIVEAACLHS